MINAYAVLFEGTLPRLRNEKRRTGDKIAAVQRQQPASYLTTTGDAPGDDAASNENDAVYP